MASNDSASGSGADRDSTDESTPASGGASAEADAPPDPTVPEGFGEPAPDREASRWGGYALAALLAVVFLIGLVRLVYPTASVMVVGTLLALFGVLVGVLAVWTRVRGS